MRILYGLSAIPFLVASCSGTLRPGDYYLTHHEMKPIPFRSTDPSLQITQADIDFVESIADSDYQALIEQISTVGQASAYCTRILSHGGNEYDDTTWGGDYWAPFSVTHESRVGDCDEGAVSAGTLLSDDGFRPYVLCMSGHQRIPVTRGVTFREVSHAVFLYKTKDGLIGSIGINDSDIQPPKAETLGEYLKIMSDAHSAQYTRATLYDLSIAFPDFIETEQNLDLHD